MRRVGQPSLCLPVTMSTTQPGQKPPKNALVYTVNHSLCPSSTRSARGLLHSARPARRRVRPVLQLRRCHKPCRLHTPRREHAVAAGTARRHADRRSKSVCRFHPVANAAGRASVRGRDPSSPSHTGHHSSSCRVEKVGQDGHARHLQSSVSERCSLPRSRP